MVAQRVRRSAVYCTQGVLSNWHGEMRAGALGGRGGSLRRFPGWSLFRTGARRRGRTCWPRAGDVMRGKVRGRSPCRGSASAGASGVAGRRCLASPGPACRDLLRWLVPALHAALLATAGVVGSGPRSVAGPGQISGARVAERPRCGCPTSAVRSPAGSSVRCRSTVAGLLASAVSRVPAHSGPSSAEHTEQALRISVP